MARKIGSKNKNQSEVHSGILLELLGVNGEMEKKDLINVVPSVKYLERVMTNLRKDGLVKDHNKDGIRCIRLTEKGKEILQVRNPERYAQFSYPDSEVVKRKRDLLISKTHVLMHGAGVQIYTDIKPDIFGGVTPPLADKAVPLSQANSLALNLGKQPALNPNPNIGSSPPSPENPPLEGKGVKKGKTGLEDNAPLCTLSQTFLSPVTIMRPSFYTSKEYKRGEWRKKGGGDPQSVMSSRSMGVLLTPSTVYNVYNTGDSLIEWDVSVERRFKAEVEKSLCGDLLPHLYHRVSAEGAGGILIGKDMMTLERYLFEVKEKPKASESKFLMDMYRSLYFISNDPCGAGQLKFASRPDLYNSLIEVVKNSYSPPSKTYAMTNDAITEDDRPVLFAIIPDIPRMVRFWQGLEETKKKGLVVCLRPQLEFFDRYFGGMAEIMHLDYFDKIKRMYLDGR